MPDRSEFQPTQAKREAAPVTAAFIGQSGSGKTLSALLFARGLVGPKGKIGIIDTEGKRSLIYANDEQIAGFEHIDFRAPWSSDRYREAIAAAVAAGWDAAVIDSASHEHEAEGGMLEYADSEERAMQNRRDKSRAKWIKPKIAHNRYIQTAKSAPLHLIFCIREKRLANMDPKPGEAKEIFEPVCDRNFLFEMMLAVRFEPGTHAATFVKVPRPFLKHIRDGEIITVEHGALLMAEAGAGQREDPAIARHRAALEEIARDSGTATLKTAWAALGAKNQRALQHELDRMKELAAETDARLAAEEPIQDRDPRDALLDTGEDAPDEIPY